MDGTVKTSLSVKTNWTTAQLNAAYNFQFVSNDGSLGIHNAPFAVGLLQASIADVSGAGANNAALQAWEVQHFRLNHHNAFSAGPNAAPAGDGIPNWLKYALGLNPLIKGLSVPNGVVWANTFQGGATNTVQIYTAAEVAFPTVLGNDMHVPNTRHRLRWGEAWQNIGAPIAGTGESISYLTPTRNNVHQFYRVMHTP